MSKIELNAVSRTDKGKGASRRLRQTGQTPAIVYGAGEPQSISLAHNELWKAQENEAFYSTILSLNVDGKAADVIVKDMQRHPAKSLVMHIDFQRTDDKSPIVVNVPLHFTNTATCFGVKMQGGSIQFIAQEVKVSCLPSALPQYLEVDMTENKVGDILHISDITLPEGVTSVDLERGADHNHPIAQVKRARGGAAAATEAATAEGGEE